MHSEPFGARYTHFLHFYLGAPCLLHCKILGDFLLSTVLQTGEKGESFQNRIWTFLVF